MHNYGTIFPHDLLPYGENKQVKLDQLFADVKLLTQNRDESLTNLTIRRPELAQALRNVYLARDIFLESRPDYFYKLLNRMPEEFNVRAIPEGTIGKFLYDTITMCLGHGTDRYCFPYKFDARPDNYEREQQITAKDSRASIWILNETQFIGIPSSDTTKADIYIPYRNMSEFTGLSAENIAQLQEAGITEACFKSNSERDDVSLTGYMPINELSKLNKQSGTRIIIHKNDANNSSNPAPGSAVWIWIIIIILLLIVAYFVATNWNK